MREDIKYKAISKRKSECFYYCVPRCVLNSLSRPATLVCVIATYVIIALIICQIAQKGRSLHFSIHRKLPSLYQHYTDQGIREGLKAPRSGFTLNGLPITIYSGAIQYFRLHPEYWRDRLRKARAAGLNAVETYVPWNLHEPRMSEFDFGDGGNELSLLLDLRRFIKLAQEEDLFVIFRPGPYICAEWEFGGLPSWLLRYDGIKVRTSDPQFLKHVRTYFDALLPLITNLTFLKGGPIIAVQVENEYGSFGNRTSKRDKVYLDFVRNEILSHGINELLFTSDSPAAAGTLGALPGVLQTANFAGRADHHFQALLKMQPHNALMVMEFWSGWFDHWMQAIHETGNPPFVFAAVLTSVLSYNASLNFYMFAGGTSYAFMSGANVRSTFPVYEPDISSYDYGAPISEAGDYTEKYRILKALIAAHNPVKTFVPSLPRETVKAAYPTVQVTDYIPILDVLAQVPLDDRTSLYKIGRKSNMESLPFNEGNGQSYGIIVYRKIFRTSSTSATLKIKGHVRDVAMVLVNGDQRTVPPSGYKSLKNFGFWGAKDAELVLLDLEPDKEYLLDIMVENMGRVNFGVPAVFKTQKKGLWEGAVLLDGEQVTDWEVIALQLKGSWVASLEGWTSVPRTDAQIFGPAMFRAQFHITDTPRDTFLDMRAWTKGCIYVNGFPLGRHFYIGPQFSTFVPAPILKQGLNEIIIFEHYAAAREIKFSNEPNLGKTRKITGNMAFYL